MTNIDKISNALGEWGFKVASSVLPKVSVPIESAIGKFMFGILGVDPRTYNIWSELGFLAEPMIQSYISPMVGKFFNGMSDEQAENIAYKFVDSFIGRAEEKGYVNMFGVQLGKDAFDDLRAILEKHMEHE